MGGWLDHNIQEQKASKPHIAHLFAHSLNLKFNHSGLQMSVLEI